MLEKVIKVGNIHFMDRLKIKTKFNGVKLLSPVKMKNLTLASLCLLLLRYKTFYFLRHFDHNISLYSIVDSIPITFSDFYLERIGLTHKNYYVARNARCARSRYTHTL